MTFVELCQERPNILSQAIVIHKLDPMNVFTAMQFFSESVEEYMTNKGYTGTAYFIKLVRNWNQACNKRGMAADERVEHMLNFFCYLTEGINFDTFPSVSTQRYIHGMTIQAFEAILHNISTHVSLYALAFGENYNTRSVSTLVSKSCNSDIHRLDKEGSEYLKACNMNKLVRKLALVNDYKHRSSSQFHLAPSLKGMYPVHLNEEAKLQLMTQDDDSTCMFRNNFFNFKDKNPRKRK